MAFVVTEPIRSKIAIGNMALEQMNPFTHIQEEKGIHSNTTKLLQILGLLNNTLKTNLVQRSTRLKLYETLALQTLLYGSDVWTLKSRHRSAEMKYLRRAAGYTLVHHKRNEEILELHVTP
jgi:hypothetical protein